MHREEETVEAPDWLGPVIGLLIILMLAGLAALLWLTIFSGDGEGEHEAALLLSSLASYAIPV